MAPTLQESQVDPVYRSSLRESLVALGAWLVCGVYSVTYCLVNGFGRTPDEIDVIWGIPDWVLFGVFLPWILCNFFAWWYCFRFVKDEDLGGHESSGESSGEADGSASASEGGVHAAG